MASERITLFHVRHAKQETLDQATHGICQLEAELNEQGQAEAEQLREFFSTISSAGAIKRFCSPVTRARQTAEIIEPGAWTITGMLGIPPNSVPVYDYLIGTCGAGSMEDIWRMDPLFVAHEAARARHVLLALADTAFDGTTTIIAVSHQPYCGLARGLIDPGFPPFQQDLPTGKIYEYNFKREHGQLQLIACEQITLD